MKILDTIRCTIILAVVLAMSSCSTEVANNQAEIDRLRNQIKEDSLFRENWAKESGEIDALLTKVAGLTEDAQGGTLVGADLVDKTQKVENLVEEVNKRIAQLEEEVATEKGKARKIPNLLQNLQRQKQNIVEQDAIMQGLQQQVEEGEEKIAALTTEVDLKGKTIEEQDEEINKKIAALNEKEQELLDKQQELEATKLKSAKDLKTQKNNFHISAGLERIEVVRLVRGMNPKKKRQLLAEAWNHFCSAHQNGHYNALTELGKLQSDKDLGRFVKDKSCE